MAVLALFRGFQHLNRAVTALLAYETTPHKAVKMSWHRVALDRPHYYSTTKENKQIIVRNAKFHFSHTSRVSLDKNGSC